MFQDDQTFEFDLSNCLEYVKAGVEAIIEDEVTSRFEAEELKNWNLLTRTNRYYEFISWRLSFIWVCGFFIRYFILMPTRVFVCFVGVSNMCMIKSLRRYFQLKCLRAMNLPEQIKFSFLFVVPNWLSSHQQWLYFIYFF